MSATAKTGDIVRFLNSVGGGRVVRIVDSIAYVEDEDGFEVPVQLRECVVVTPSAPTVATQSKAQQPSFSKETKIAEAAPKKIQDVLNSIETPGGDVLNLVLGFEPEDLKALSHTDFDAYFVNDSNYKLFVTILSRANEDREWTLRFAGNIDPNMEEHVMNFAQPELAKMDRIAVQYQAYKEGKAFAMKSPALVELKLDTTKFAKLHCFRSGTYFETPVIALDIVRDDRPCVRQAMPEPAKIAEAMMRPEPRKNAPKPVVSRPKPSAPHKDEPIVVDLHASELFDDMRGLSNADILNRQIDRFTEVMEANLHAAGRKIVFIHGKGEGVLRQALMKELTHRFKGHDVQDASFQEYGYGATQVTIRPMAAKKAGKK